MFNRFFRVFVVDRKTLRRRFARPRCLPSRRKQCGLKFVKAVSARYCILVYVALRRSSTFSRPGSTRTNADGYGHVACVNTVKRLHYAYPIPGRLSGQTRDSAVDVGAPISYACRVPITRQTFLSVVSSLSTSASDRKSRPTTRSILYPKPHGNERHCFA